MSEELKALIYLKGIFTGVNNERLYDDEVPPMYRTVVLTGKQYEEVMKILEKFE